MYFLFWSIIIFMTVIGVIALSFKVKKNDDIPVYFYLVIVLLFPMMTLTLYWKLGDSQPLIHYWELKQRAIRVNEELAALKNPNEVIDRLNAYLQQHPNHPKGWYLLGKIYYKQQSFKKAVIALEKAHQQSPGNLDYAVAYAEADFFYRGRHLRPETKKTLQNVIEHDKNNVAALNLLAINAYLHGHYQKAIHYWERLLPLFSVGSKDHSFLLSMIAKAQGERSVRNKQ